MQKKEGSVFRSPELTLLNRGILEVNAMTFSEGPASPEAIQVGGFESTSQTKLIITKGGSNDGYVSAERTDGKPMLIEVVNPVLSERHPNRYKFVRHLIFETPPEKLVFVQIGNDENNWRALGLNLEIIDQNGVNRLGQTIGAYALMQQNRYRDSRQASRV